MHRIVILLIVIAGVAIVAHIRTRTTPKTSASLLREGFVAASSSVPKAKAPASVEHSFFVVDSKAGKYSTCSAAERADKKNESCQSCSCPSGYMLASGDTTCGAKSCANPDHVLHGDRCTEQATVRKPTSTIPNFKTSAAPKNMKCLSNEKLANVAGNNVCYKGCPNGKLIQARNGSYACVNCDSGFSVLSFKAGSGNDELSCAKCSTGDVTMSTSEKTKRAIFVCGTGEDPVPSKENRRTPNCLPARRPAS